MTNRLGSSRAFALFVSRMADASLYLEGSFAASDLLLTAAQTDTGGRTVGDVLGLPKAQRKRLKMPRAHAINLVNMLRSTTSEYVLHAAYADFSEYLRQALRGMYDHDPLLVAGKAPGRLEYHEIIQLGSYEAIKDTIVEQVFRRLESTKATASLLERILAQTGVTIDREIVRRAMMYLDARHLVVHCGGRIDQKYLDEYRDLIKVPTKVGGRFQLSKGFALTCIRALSDLVGAIDAGLVSKGFLHSPDGKSAVVEEMLMKRVQRGATADEGTSNRR